MTNVFRHFNLLALRDKIESGYDFHREQHEEHQRSFKALFISPTPDATAIGIIRRTMDTRIEDARTIKRLQEQADDPVAKETLTGLYTKIAMQVCKDYHDFAALIGFTGGDCYT